jgi:hypothetical protein
MDGWFHLPWPLSNDIQDSTTIYKPMYTNAVSHFLSDLDASPGLLVAPLPFCFHVAFMGFSFETVVMPRRSPRQPALSSPLKQNWSYPVPLLQAPLTRLTCCWTPHWPSVGALTVVPSARTCLKTAEFDSHWIHSIEFSSERRTSLMQSGPKSQLA